MPTTTERRYGFPSCGASLLADVKAYRVHACERYLLVGLIKNLVLLNHGLHVLALGKLEQGNSMNMVSHDDGTDRTEIAGYERCYKGVE